MATVTITPGYQWTSGEVATAAKLTSTATPTATATLVDGEVTTAKIADAGVTDLKLADTLNLSSKTVTLPATIALPAGAVMAFAMNSAPSGWLAANGAAVSRATYATLFSAIGTTHGAGNGSTTFNVPNLQGIFVRGSGSQTISGATYSGTFAAKQNDLLKDHTHTYVRPTVATDGSNLKNINGGSLDTFSTGGVEDGGGAETRPANIALLYCIKF
jgi:hypothetical protein